MEGIGSDPDLSSLKLQGFEHSLSFGWWVLSGLAVVLSGIRFLEANSAPCALLLGTAQISCSLLVQIGGALGLLLALLE